MAFGSYLKNMSFGSDPRVLNILQMDVSFKNSPVGQICTFSNLSDVPVQGPNCEVSEKFWDCWIETMIEFKNRVYCDERRCVFVFDFKTVCHGEGAVLDLANEEYYTLIFDKFSLHGIVDQNLVKIHSGKTLVIKMDGYALSFFLSCLKRSPKYVELVTNYLCDLLEDTRMFVVQLGQMKIMTNRCKISLHEPDAHLLDLAWARRAYKLVQDLRLLQSTMSWLSTLGGAFSALGEEQQTCAVTAGRISMEQLNLALRMGDKIVVAQCKLYFSLSLIQRGHTSRARVIIYEQFMNQKNSRLPDIKTMNMCKGIWSRLKYAIAQRRALGGKP